MNMHSNLNAAMQLASAQPQSAVRTIGREHPVLASASIVNVETFLLFSQSWLSDCTHCVVAQPMKSRHDFGTFRIPHFDLRAGIKTFAYWGQSSAGPTAELTLAQACTHCKSTTQA